MTQDSNDGGKKNWESIIAEDAEDDVKKPKRRRRRFGQIGFLGWLMVFLTAIIVIGIGALLYQVWSFQTQSRSKQSLSEGLVPVVGDFLPGKPKKNDVVFRLAGNKRNGEKLFPELVSAWMRARGYSGVSQSFEKEIVTISGSKNGKRQRVVIALGSAKGGFDAMIQNRVDGVIASRQIDASEADRLSAYGDMFSPMSERIVGHDVSYIFVNPSNAVDNINGETLGRILSGEITDWSEISDKEDGAINIRLENQGADRDLGQLAKLLGDREMIETAKTYDNPDDVVGAVGRDGDAIGFAHAGSGAGNVKEISVNERNAGIFAPNPFNIATESYPFTERVYLYVGGTNGNQNLIDFADYVVSPAGQEIVKRIGLGAQIPEALAIKPPQGAPSEYVDFSNIARRMNFDFRFHQGTNELDNKAFADLNRFAAYMQKEGIDSKRVALLGFADNVGAEPTNLGLAQSRAEMVATKLAGLGINPAIIKAYGDKMPVGANAYEAGRIKNRRVEIWVCPPPSCPVINIGAISVPKAPTADDQIMPSGVRWGPSKPAPGEEAPKG